MTKLVAPIAARNARQCFLAVLAIAVIVLVMPFDAVAALNCAKVEDGILEADVPTVTVTANFQLNGSEFPSDSANAARISLVKDGLVQAVLGDTDLPLPAVHVLSGTYDLLYQHKAGALVPQNVQAIFARDVPVTTSGELNVNVPSVVQVGDFVLDGGAFPASDFEDARIYAVKSDDGDEVFLGNTQDGGYSRSLLPGDYDIIYRIESGGFTVPRNTGALVDSRAVVTNDFSADVLVTSVVQSGDFLFNGSLAPATPFENGEITLRTLTGDAIGLGETMEQSYSVRIIPGSYDIHYDNLVSNGTAPINQDKRLLQAVELNGGDLDINVISRTVVGDFTVNGAATPSTVFDNAQISLIDRQTGAEMVLGDTMDQSYTQRLIPGSYDAVYRSVTVLDEMPLNTFSIIDRVAVPESFLIQVELDINIPRTSVSVTGSLDGQPWPSAGISSGELSLHTASGALSLLLGTTQELPIIAPIVSGFYSLEYSHQAGSDVPSNERASASTLQQLSGVSDTIHFSLQSMVLQPDLTLNSQPWPAAADQSGRLFFTAGEDFLELAPTHAPVPSRVLKDTYQLRYAHVAGNTVPENFLQNVTCVYADECVFCDGFETALP